MSESDVGIRHILKFYCKKGQNVIQAAEKVCDVYGPNAVSVRVAQSWFKCFQSGNFDVRDEPRPGRPLTDKVDAILEKGEQDRRITPYDITEKLSIDQKNSFDLF
ncbi:Histone-lysine N-methyltransferase SETMAR [Eumeta japonica]|uniref:Histone-lysine N-methyltransferase SETMAR n=1 Tax=Eumeta variegata TaxID=151549 RepID=A0A4C1YLZ3_EUMVA|nr:Histone-lysine N-methyltransferase SETMAR [Eumeta japonica]